MAKFRLQMFSSTNILEPGAVPHHVDCSIVKGVHFFCHFINKLIKKISSALSQ